MESLLKRCNAKDVRSFLLIVAGGVLGILVACSFYYLLYCILGFYTDVCGEYELCTMLVSYELGWVPRGLLGTLLLVFGAENTIFAAGLLTNGLLIAFLLSIVGVVRHLWQIDKNKAALALPFLVWPGLFVLGIRISQPRADVIMYLLFWLCVLVAVSRPTRLVLATVVCGVVMMLIHEGWVFVFLPFLLFLIWSFVGFKQAVVTGVILLIPFLLVELLPHVGADEVVDYLISRKQVAGWYDQTSDRLSFWKNGWTEMESMAYYQYGNHSSLLNIVNTFEGAGNMRGVTQLLTIGLRFLAISIPQLLLCGVTVGKKYGARLALCVVPFLVLMLGTQLDWIRFIPMYTFGFGATVFALWLREYVKLPFDISVLERAA